MKKQISLLLAIVMLLCCVSGPIHVSAAENGQKLYLKPSSNWLEANARFAAYYWDSNGNSAWTGMADTDNDGYYEIEIPAGNTNVIFCRMNPGTADNNWDNKWNQTGDLTVPTDGNNCYTVPEGSWDGADNTNWSVYAPKVEELGEQEPAAREYYLYGYIDYADVASNEHKFDNGKLNITITAAAYYITAQGVPFIHAGEEMLRSKPDAAQDNGFNHNSYASGDEINAIKWYTLRRPLVVDSVDYYTGLIAFRKAHPALRMTTKAEIQAAMSVLDTGDVNVIAVVNNGGNGEEAQILTIINADVEANTVTLPEGEWNVYVNKDDAGTEILTTVEGTVEVESTSAMILVKAEKPDAEDLKELVAEAMRLNKKDYTSKSYKALKDALKDAQKILKKGRATEEQIIEAYDALQEAIDNLVEKPKKNHPRPFIPRR